jgi:hypothetical protein
MSCIIIEELMLMRYFPNQESQQARAICRQVPSHLLDMDVSKQQHMREHAGKWVLALAGRFGPSN